MPQNNLVWIRRHIYHGLDASRSVDPVSQGLPCCEWHLADLANISPLLLVTHAASTGSMSLRQRSTGNNQRTADVDASMISPAEEISWHRCRFSIAKQTSGSGKARNLIPIEGQNLRVG